MPEQPERSKKPPLSSPQRRYHDFLEMNASWMQMVSDKYGTHFGAVMRGDFDFEALVSTEEFQPTIGEAADQVRRAIEPILVSAFQMPQQLDEPRDPEPVPDIDFEPIETAQMDDVPVELPDIATSEFATETEFEAPDSAIIDEEPAEFVVDLPEAEPIMVGDDLAPLPPVQPPPPPIDTPFQLPPPPAALSRPIQRAAPPPPARDPGAIERVPMRSFAPFLQQAPAQAPDDPLGAVPPPPPPVNDGTGAVMFDHGAESPLIIRDPVGTLVDRQFTGGETAMLEAERGVLDSVEPYLRRNVDVLYLLTSLLHDSRERLEYLIHSLASEHVDEEL